MDNPFEPTSTLDSSSDATTTFVSIATSVATAILTSAISGNSSTDVNSPIFDPGDGLDDVIPTLGNDGNPFVRSSPRLIALHQLTTSPVTHPTSTTHPNPQLNFLIGFIIVLTSSILNAFGLNLTKLDHVRNTSLPKSQRKPDWMRPLWGIGMLAYISSQLFGSTLSLRYLRSDWVAPLGSSSLVFNFLFAKWLVGTPVTKEDVRGTALIVVAVILILIFSSINHGLDQTINVDRLTYMWRRKGWLAWFSLISFLTLSVYTSTHLLSMLLKSRASLSPTIATFDPSLPPTSGGGRRKSGSNGFVGYLKVAAQKRRDLESMAVGILDRRVFERTDDNRLRWLEGIGWAVVGGSLAGGCLVFTKAVVKLLSQPDKPFTHFASLITLLMVIITAVMQIICLNRALKCADSTLVVPLFFAGYTVLGFVNSLIFLAEWGQYATWVLVATFLSICLLVSGVVLLSLKKPEPNGETNTVSVTNPHMRLNPVHGNGSATDAMSSSRRPGTTRARSGSNRSAMKRTNSDSASINAMGVAERSAWEVGSASDGSDDEDGKGGRGVGGMKSMDGERGGLLFESEEEDHEVDKGKRNGAAAAEKDYAAVVPPEEDVEYEDDGEDPFGDFEDVQENRKES